MTRLTLLVAWLVSAAVPLTWWLWTRRHVDVWRSLPVPTGLLTRTGEVRATAGPASEVSFATSGGLPAPGKVVRVRGTDGTPLAIAGVRGGGALAVALP